MGGEGLDSKMEESHMVSWIEYESQFAMGRRSEKPVQPFTVMWG